jgi:hypothetical protein
MLVNKVEGLKKKEEKKESKTRALIKKIELYKIIIKRIELYKTKFE